MLIGGPEYRPIYGGEAVRLAGKVVGRLRSAGYGYGVSATIGTVYLPAEVSEGEALEVDVLDGRVPGVVVADVLHDPSGSRMRA